MDKVIILKIFTLAAAAVAPHLIALDSKAITLKHIDKLSTEERITIEDLTEKAVYYTTKTRSPNK